MTYCRREIAFFGLAAGLFGAMMLAAIPARAALPAKPGDTGQIEFELENEIANRKLVFKNVPFPQKNEPETHPPPSA